RPRLGLPRRALAHHRQQRRQIEWFAQRGNGRISPPQIAQVGLGGRGDDDDALEQRRLARGELFQNVAAGAAGNQQVEDDGGVVDPIEQEQGLIAGRYRIDLERLAGQKYIQETASAGVVLDDK